MFSLPEGYKGKLNMVHNPVFLVYSTLLYYSTIIQLFIHSYCKHLDMYKCVYSNNNKGPIRWDI